MNSFELKTRLKDKMEKLIGINEAVKQKQNEIDVLKKHKHVLDEEIQILIEKLNLGGSVFKYKDFKIQQKQVTHYQSFSLKLIQDCLSQYFNNNNQNTETVDEIMTLLKDKREKKVKNEIKIY
tara:strand:- start:280 stop:648 length:369 start_codon:yes stop_codon:yes gene_type:complete